MIRRVFELFDYYVFDKICMFKYKIIEDSGCIINLIVIFVFSFVIYKNNVRFVIFFFVDGILVLEIIR